MESLSSEHSNSSHSHSGQPNTRTAGTSGYSINPPPFKAPSGDELKKGALDAFQRAKFVLLNPSSCWDTIAAEPTSIKDIYLKYIMYLALLPAVGGLIGLSLVGITIPGLGTWHAPFFSNLVGQIVGYGVALASVYVGALVIQFLAPKFGGSNDLVGAAKLLAYSFTPAWVAGILQIIPVLGLLSILLLLYGIFIFAQGPTKVLAVPQEKRLVFTAASIVSIFVVQIILGVLIHMASPVPSFPNPSVTADDLKGLLQQ